MATITVKAVISVEVPEPTSVLEKQSTKERNEEIKNIAESRIMDALTLSELQPAILRIRIARKGETNNE
jgi:hypothetical protein